MYHVSLSPLRTIIIFRASWKKSPQTTRSTIPINHFYCFPFACSHFRGSDLCEYYSIGSWFSAYLSWGSHVRNAIEIHKHRTKALVLHTKRCRPQTMHGKSGIDHHRWIHYDAIQQSNPHVHSFQWTAIVTKSKMLKWTAWIKSFWCRPIYHSPRLLFIPFSPSWPRNSRFPFFTIHFY